MPKQQAGFIEVPEHLSGKIREVYGIKDEEAETKPKGKLELELVFGIALALVLISGGDTQAEFPMWQGPRQ